MSRQRRGHIKIMYQVSSKNELFRALTIHRFRLLRTIQLAVSAYSTHMQALCHNLLAYRVLSWTHPEGSLRIDAPTSFMYVFRVIRR